MAALDVWYDSERKIGNYPPELAYRKKKDTETAASMSSMFSVSTSLSDREMIERLLPRSLF